MPDSTTSTWSCTERDERGEDVARGAQLLDLNLQRLALHREVVQDGLSRVVGLLDDRAALLARTLDERLAVDLRGLHESFGGQSGVVIDLARPCSRLRRSSARRVPGPR